MTLRARISMAVGVLRTLACMPAPARPRATPTTTATAVVVPLVLALVLPVGGCTSRPGVNPANLALTDLDGHAATLRLEPGTRAVVFVFLGVECPIANRCAPELASLESRLGPRGIRFCHVYPNADEGPAAIRKHRQEHALGPAAFRDPGHALAQALNAHRTPEAVALTPDGRLIYQGRVNDQYAALGVNRPQPTRHDLGEALEGFLAGARPAGLVTPGVGCTFRNSP